MSYGYYYSIGSRWLYIKEIKISNKIFGRLKYYVYICPEININHLNYISYELQKNSIIDYQQL